MTKELKRLNILGGVFVGLLIVVAVLGYALKHDGERKVLLSFDVEPVDGDDAVLDVIGVLESYGAQGTFFVTGEYAEENPELVRWISASHEVGCHSYSHKKLTLLDIAGKTEEIRRCKETVENVTGKKVMGFRAPWHKIDREGLEVLEEEGFLYDASVISGLGWIYPSMNGLSLGEVPVSSFMMIPIEDTVWLYYLKMRPLYFMMLKTKNTGLESYVFHPHMIAPEIEDFDGFINHLKRSNAKFITHSELIMNHEITSGG